MVYRKRFALATFIAASSLFAIIAANLAQGGPFGTLDTQVAAWLHSHASPALTRLMLILTHAHAPLAVCGYAILLSVFFAARREWYWLHGLVLAVPGGLLINVLLKHLFQRARPVADHPVLSLITYSFPSGHTAGTTLFYGVLAAYLVSKHRSSAARVAFVMGWCVLVVLVGSSRIYFGVHFLTDVLGAVAWSLAWLSLCLIAGRALHARGASRAPE